MKLRNYSISYYNAMNYNSAITSESEYKTGGIHPTYELLFLASGSFRLHWLGEQYEVSPQSLFIITPNTPHDLIITSQQAVYWYIELTEVTAEPLFAKLQNVLLWNRLQCGIDAAFGLSPLLKLCLQGISSMLDSRVQDQPYGEEILLLDVEKILLMVRGTVEEHQKDLKQSKSRSLPTGYSLSKDVVKALARHMESAYKFKITLADLTRISNFQATYLIKRFKEETGFTPIDYLLELRMEAAKTYLSTTEMPIQIVASETGYPNIYHFSGEFKRKTGFSPTDWRKKNRQQKRGYL
ncbi:AraC family transcriptional regulator [Paenibacillus psychroresistens]|uniref:AraC family transcriptional regulator n=1 Tax=Paenibacillus psychroresistens TaxID=1778678 RepID=A0A6B8RE86_9BACL|nr:AraC family transcriptional regulator [Paenibacillus psychroresistens]QGQ94227.1 AraC family transcriptional regulator [Paenibacillus psychroresistens]